MKKLVLACCLLFVVAAVTAPSAQALPVCFKWVSFCDGVGVNNVGLGGSYWYHWDCASDSSMDSRLKQGGTWVSNCGTNGKGLVRSVAPNGPGDYYFVVDVPLDGTLDMHSGTYPNGACWIPALAYNLQMGACTGIQGQGRSTVQ
jgi:hypothetical protein